jgi:hypothetical protein
VRSSRTVSKDGNWLQNYYPEDSVNISHQVDEYTAVPFNYVLTRCDHANEGCPSFPCQLKSRPQLSAPRLGYKQ